MGNQGSFFIMQENGPLPMKECVMVGMGLMGTSMVKAMKEAAPLVVKGIDLYASPIEKASREHVIDDGAVLSDTDKVRSLLSGSRFIILALYPSGILPFIETFRDCFAPGTLIMDICGLKGAFVASAQQLLPEGVEYLGTHPMAGKEKSGYENGDSELFLGASFIITPTELNSETVIEAARRIALSIGCGKIRLISPEEHDRIIAYTSHLPHVMAASLIRCWHDSEDVASYTGGSFRDATRVAEINTGLWTQLFMANKDQLDGILTQYIEELETFRALLDNQDEEGMKRFLEESSERKTRWMKRGDRYDG